MNPSLQLPRLDPRQFELENHYQRMIENRFSAEEDKIGMLRRKAKSTSFKGDGKKKQVGPFSNRSRVLKKDNTEEEARCRYYQVRDKERGLGKMTKSQYSVAMAEKNELLKRVLFG